MRSLPLSALLVALLVLGSACSQSPVVTPLPTTAPTPFATATSPPTVTPPPPTPTSTPTPTPLPPHPFVGTWKATDPWDGSTIFMEITERAESPRTHFVISATDDLTGSWCTTRGPAKMTASGILRDDTTMDVSYVWFCVPPGKGQWPPSGSEADVYIYDGPTDTITAAWKTVFSRVP